MIHAFGIQPLNSSGRVRHRRSRKLGAKCRVRGGVRRANTVTAWIGRYDTIQSDHGNMDTVVSLGVANFYLQGSFHRNTLAYLKALQVF